MRMSNVKQQIGKKKKKSQHGFEKYMWRIISLLISICRTILSFLRSTIGIASLILLQISISSIISFENLVIKCRLAESCGVFLMDYLIFASKTKCPLKKISPFLTARKIPTLKYVNNRNWIKLLEI